MKVFIGSSAEANEQLLMIAAWIEELSHEPIPWNKPSLFLPGEYTLAKLLAISRSVDAAVFIFAEDDKVWYRKDSLAQPRDNVLMEYGMFSGTLGQGAAIICTSGKPKIPTDIHGIGLVDISSANVHRAKTRFAAWLKELAKEKRIAPSTGVKVFESPADVKYNHEFYRYFVDTIRSAKQDIYITGEGFECADNEGRGLAEKFVAAFSEALGHNVRVIRVQTRLQTNSLWASMLANLLKDHQHNFYLYALKKEKVSQMSSVCVIDPECASNTVEIMLSTQRLFGTTAADVAGTAVFIHGQQMLAQDLRRRILTLTEPQVSVRLADAEDVQTSLCGEEFYFAYGSNMVEEQMKERCKSAVRIGIGLLNDHRIVFNRKGTYRSGGVASIEECNGQRVYGVIWKILSSEFWELDEKEDAHAYRRKKTSVATLTGQQCSCHIYEAIPQNGVFKPDKDYLRIMISGAREANLPAEYVKYLQSFMV